MVCQDLKNGSEKTYAEAGYYLLKSVKRGKSEDTMPLKEMLLQ